MRRWREGRAARRSGSASPPNPEDQQLSELERLAALHDSGALDDEEFKAQKAKVLL